LARVEGDVGVFQQDLRAVAVLGVGGDADAGADGDLPAVEFHRRGEAGDQAGRELRGVFRRCGRQHNGELVAAEAGHGVAVAHAMQQPLAGFDEHPVAGGVAHQVVHGFEAVEVDAEQRHGTVGARRLGDSLGRAGRPAGRGWRARSARRN